MKFMHIMTLMGGMGLGLMQCEGTRPAPKPIRLSQHPYSIDLEFSPGLAKAMTDARDTITVSALYYGDPKPGEMTGTDSLGRVKLGDEEKGAVASSREVHMAGAFDASKLAFIRDDPQVLVNVFSTTPVGNLDGLLVCHSWIGLLKETTQAPPLIICGRDENDLDKMDHAQSVGISPLSQRVGAAV